MRVPALFTGIFATFALAWFGETVIPQIQLGNLQPQTEEDGSDPYPVNNSGIVARGRKVFVSEGCFYCHTQMVRGELSGSDIARGWGARRTVARDYIYDEPAVLGLTRNGPDLANIGNQDVIDASTKEKRWKDASWHYLHLYNPRIKVEGSLMPSFSYLFEKRKIAGERSVEALPLQGENDAGNGYEVVPSSDARALVAYLLSLDRSHPLNEVKQEAPAK
jgi:cytochrome c oxidase cbb3-type subunit 2